jgi:hypothetical protein
MQMKQMNHRFVGTIGTGMLFFMLLFPVLSSGEAAQAAADSTDTRKAGVSSDYGDNYLREARLKLGNAFDSYRKGDLAATEISLDEATKSLNKAAENSRTEKAKAEARKLAAEIGEFRKKINQTSDQHENSIARFWHRTSSIIRREADHLIHSYMELSTAEKTQKYLLDAKMHLFNAEHDLFVSHDKEDAEDELVKVLDYLDEAGRVAIPAVKHKIDLLTGDIRSLKEKTTTTSGIWKKNNVINALDAAIKELAFANENAVPAIKLRIEQLQTEMHALRSDVQRNSIRDDYDSSMAAIRNIINEL